MSHRDARKSQILGTLWSKIRKKNACSASFPSSSLDPETFGFKKRNGAKDLAGAGVSICNDRMNPAEENAAEAHLVDRARAGDGRSFETLFDRYYDMIYAFAYRFCLVKTEADDIAQETFIRAARSLGTFRGEASFKNWLYRIAHHAATDLARRGSRRDRQIAELTREMEISAQGRPADYTPIHSALRQLPSDWREALTLVFFEEMSHAEAAAILGCAETTISWRIFRAKRALKKLLVSHQEGERGR
jgi:RNA polymerase sigma-70 factor (ECF subfamily)